jgi:hypothetical protein
MCFCFRFPLQRLQKPSIDSGGLLHALRLVFVILRTVIQCMGGLGLVREGLLLQTPNGCSGFVRRAIL